MPGPPLRPYTVMAVVVCLLPAATPATAIITPAAATRHTDDTLVHPVISTPDTTFISTRTDDELLSNPAILVPATTTPAAATTTPSITHTDGPFPHPGISSPAAKDLLPHPTASTSAISMFSHPANKADNDDPPSPAVLTPAHSAKATSGDSVFHPATILSKPPHPVTPPHLFTNSPSIHPTAIASESLPHPNTLSSNPLFHSTSLTSDPYLHPATSDKTTHPNTPLSDTHTHPTPPTSNSHPPRSTSTHHTPSWLDGQQFQNLIVTPKVPSQSSIHRFSRAWESGGRVRSLEHDLEGLRAPTRPSGLTRTNEMNLNVKLSPMKLVHISDTRPLSSSTLQLSIPRSKNQITRRSADAVTSNQVVHRHRHGHSGTPRWLRRGSHDASLAVKNQVVTRHFEEEIAAVFRGVAYGRSEPKVMQKKYDEEQVGSAGVSSRIERTTVSEEPQNDYVVGGSGGGATRGQRNASPPDSVSTSSMEERDSKRKEEASEKSSSVPTNSTNEVMNKTRKSAIEKILESKDYDHEEHDHSESPSLDLHGADEKASISRRGDTKAGETSLWASPANKGTDELNATKNNSQAAQTQTRKPNGSHKPTARLSWFDVLLCTNRNLTWILINFFLGFVLLSVSFLGPYRLLTLRFCTPLLPRTHYVAVHLLVFVAASLKAVYLFHLAYGSRGRLPLILILLLTNTGFPCFSSAFLILMIMMFLTADVQVYKPKLLTMQNIFIFIVMKLVLCFVADVIVGCAHSRSVLVLSRVMLIIVAVTIILAFIRKHQLVLQVSQILQREFQGELKLLVLPAKDVSQQRQMGIKFILRNRLSLWCQVMKVATVCIALLAVIHLFHTIFLISSHVPTWAWWIFHVSGCVVESILSVLICVAAALTQRYDEKISFIYNFFIPSVFLRNQKAVKSKARNGDAIYQRVSFSSGTESTQYATCYPEAGRAGLEGPSRTPKAPKRRGATVRRSATFSHAPYYRPEVRLGRGRAVPRPVVPRAGSATQIPMYTPASGSHLSIYGPSLVSHLPVYSPPSDASVLVHEDGFVRVRTQMDPAEGILYPRGSLIRLQQSHFLGSHPQLQEPSAQHLNGPGRQESFYASLSRRRRNPPGADYLQNNIDAPESDYHPSPRPGRSHSHCSYPYPASQTEADYHNLSRKRSFREPHVEQLNNVDEESDYPRRRRRNSREPRHYYLNNLDQPDSDYRSLTRRQVSKEDNNDPINQLGPGSDIRRNDRLMPMNLYEERYSHPGVHSHHASPSTKHKISNIAAPVASPAVSPAHSSYASASPRSTKREAHYPKPFVRAGSNTSLQNDDYFYGDYIPRGNPVRRNHSSAGYFPSRNPPSPSLTDTRRYGSLRLGATRKRQAGGNGRRGYDYYDRYKRTEEEDTVGDLPRTRGPKCSPRDRESQDERERECPSRQSNVSKRSDGSDQDWALELIKSSSMLTDFYSLERPKSKSPRNKETDSPRNKETDSPRNKETDSPRNKETDSPRNKETDSPRNKETDSPGNKEPDSPGNMETDSLRDEDTGSPSSKDSASQDKDS